MQLCSFCARKWIDRYALIKGHVEKNLERLCTSVRARQNPSGTSLGQTSKQLHAGAIKPEPGFCGSGFWFFQSIRFPFHVGSEDEIVEEKNLYSLPCIVTRTGLFFNLLEERWRDVFTRQTKTVDIVFACFDWLLKLGICSQIHLDATPNSSKLRAKWLPGLLP